VRKLGLVSSLWAALLLFPLTVLALGLGEIEVNSFLNQPLKAEIKVISARPGEIDDLLISLASRDAFRKAGLERPAALSKLKFKVNKSEDGQSATVSVSTKTPVKEPFLSFLVEADWAKGRLLREFTVLLDPPSFAQQALTTTAEPQSTAPVAESAPIATEQPAAMAQPEPAPMASTQSASQPIAIAEQPASYNQQQTASEPESNMMPENAPDQVIVQKGDTLWGIASQYKDDDHSMAQVMLALQMMNPEAFGQDNINNLKVGSVLRVPELNTLDNLSKKEAYAQVLEQNGLWDEYVARKSGVASTASPTSGTAGVSSEPAEESQLSLLTPGEGDSDNASLQNNAGAEVEDAGKIRKQLALAEEELEAARLENEDLNSRVQSLEDQLAKFEELQKMVQIQDDSLAQMQNTTAEQAQSAAAEQVAPEMMETETVIAEEAAAPGDEVIVETEEAIEESPSDIMVEAASEIMQQEVAPEEPAEQAMSDDAGTMMDQADDSMLSTEAETVLPTNEETVEEPTQEQTATVPAPAIITESPDSTFDGGLMDMIPSMDDVLNDPIMLGGLGGVLALILGFILLRRKKSDKDSDSGIIIEEPENTHLDDDATPIHVLNEADTVAIEELANDETENDETDIETAILDTEQHMAETLVTEADDEEDEFAKTAIISADDLPETEQIESLPEEQDDILNEVDVYLAYGLYDNAEELLKQSLDNSPERADYRAKLLDTYFATKNKDAFVKEAEMLKSLGGAADRFWDRVQVMGFELAPDNEMFSGAKDSSVSVEELEFAKPETPDFDIGADEEETDFSSTDFNLGEQALDAASDLDDDFSSTQNLDDLNVEFPDLDADEEAADSSGDELDLDFAAELDLSVEDEEPSDDDKSLAAELNADEFSIEESSDEISLELDDDEISFDLPEESSNEENQEIIELEPTVEAPPAMDEIPEMDEDDEVKIDLGEDELSLQDDSATSDAEPADTQQQDDVLTSETLVVAPGEDIELEVAEEVELALDEGLDFDMSDMDEGALNEGDFSPSETVALAEINISDDDITEFRPAEMTGEFDAFNAEEAEGEQEKADEPVLAEVDAASGLDKTGTFAPGDFNDQEEEKEEDTAATESKNQSDDLDDMTDIDDIEDLMLPDDVDEVATKLDLAKAFIDMGDAEGARSSLEEVMTEGTEAQKAEATGLLEQIK
jgi:pilus assembly protein FimV